MLAFNTEMSKIVFLKDYWRADVGGMEKEGKIYVLFGKGDDVRDHTALTHTLRNEKWTCWSREIVLFRQCILSLNVIARHLTSFNASWEFVSAIADTMEGKMSFVNFIRD